MTTLATTDISPYEFQYQGRTIILIDTPGINQPFVSEAEVLTRLLRWVREIYGPEGKLSGIIYLHDINAVRMQGSVLRGLNGLAELCGDESFDKLVLGTTFGIGSPRRRLVGTRNWNSSGQVDSGTTSSSEGLE